MRTACLAALVLACSTFAASAAADESIIKIPNEHPDYRFEAEPHGLIGYAGPFEGGRAAVGAGFRGTIVLLQNGFIPSINNSVGISFGGDIFFGHSDPVLFIPVAMQWNFWLTNHWSVFGEPGLGIAANPERGRDTFGPIFNVGGRYHFNDKVSLTLRIGYPSFSVGASFFL